MFATIANHSINTSGDDGLYERSAVMCVGHRVHLHRFMVCKFESCRETVISCRYTVSGPCDGSCQRQRIVMLPDGAAWRVREFLATLGKDGMRLRKGIVYATGYHGRDSHQSYVCLQGQVHIVQNRSESEVQADYRDIEACDGSCKPRRIRLPSGAVKLVREAFPALFPQPEAEAVAKSA